MAIWVRIDLGESRYVSDFFSIPVGGAATVVSSAWAIAKLALPYVQSNFGKLVSAN